MDVVLAALEAAGSDQTRESYLRHGAREPLFGDRTAQAGWDLLNLVALGDEAVPDDYSEAKLRLITERIESYGNWTRRSASNTITGIGLRSDALEASARRAAAEMGSVEFDLGETSCVMPDPIAYLEKTKAHRARQAERRAARSRS